MCRQVVMHRRKDGRVGVDLSPKDIFPTRTLLVLDAAHLDVASRALRKSRLDAFGRLDGRGTDKREVLTAMVQIILAVPTMVSTEVPRPRVALGQNVHRLAMGERFAGEVEPDVGHAPRAEFRRRGGKPCIAWINHSPERCTFVKDRRVRARMTSKVSSRLICRPRSRLTEFIGVGFERSTRDGTVRIIHGKFSVKIL